MAEFDEWITGKYLEWRGDKVGRGGTVSAFARYVGVDQSIMSYWMSGRNTPDSAKSINALVSRFGGEVYDVLGIVPVTDIEIENDSSIREVVELMKTMDRDNQRKVVFAVRAMAVISGHKVVKSEGRSDDQTKVD